MFSFALIFHSEFTKKTSSSSGKKYLWYSGIGRTTKVNISKAWVPLFGSHFWNCFPWFLFVTYQISYNARLSDMADKKTDDRFFVYVSVFNGLQIRNSSCVVTTTGKDPSLNLCMYVRGCLLCDSNIWNTRNANNH